jgi:hypothetical protein
MAGLYSRTILVRHYETPTDDVEPRESAGVPAIDRGHILASTERRAAMFGYVFDGWFGGFLLARRLEICPHRNFFFYAARRNSASFAPPCPRKSFVAHRLANGSGAKRAEFRLGRHAKTPEVRRNSPGSSRFGLRCAKFSAMGFAHLRILDTALIESVERAPVAHGEGCETRLTSENLQMPSR